MLLHRYKIKFGSVSWVSYKYRLLRIWMFLSFGVFYGIGSDNDLVYSSILFWFIELLVVYLATENLFFRRIIPRMLISLSLLFGILYIVRFNFLNEHDFGIQRINDVLVGLSIWHFITYCIALLTMNFNKYLNYIRRKKHASKIK